MLGSGEGTHAPSPPNLPASTTSQDSPSPTDPDRPSGLLPLPLPRRELGPKDLSDEAQMNVACDQIAEEAAKDHIADPQAPDISLLAPPYEGSKAMLKIDGTWITSHYGREIHRASKGPKIVKYCKKRHNWDQATVDLINWELIGKVRRKQKWHHFVHTMKIMHGWLPVMHNLGKYKGIKQCPGCECPDETFLHLFSCGHHMMKEKLEEALQAMHDSLLNWEVHCKVVDAFLMCVRNGISGKSIQMPLAAPKLQQAVKDQIRIRTDKLLQGFLAKSWVDALVESRSKRPDIRAADLHRSVWDTLFRRLWDTRNHILHNTLNAHNRAEQKELAQKLHWYRENRHHVLSEGDCKWAMHDTFAIEQMGRRTRRKWVQHLDKLSKAYAIEKESRDKGQQPITDIFERLTSPPRPKARRAAGRRQERNRRRTVQSKLAWNGKEVTVKRGNWD